VGAILTGGNIERARFLEVLSGRTPACATTRSDVARDTP
jgi:hypothetical protein